MRELERRGEGLQKIRQERRENSVLRRQGMQKTRNEGGREDKERGEKEKKMMEGEEKLDEKGGGRSRGNRVQPRVA